MFTVRVVFLDDVDEYGYAFRDYAFEDAYKARAFYDLKMSECKENELVSISCDWYWTWRRDFKNNLTV